MTIQGPKTNTGIEVISRAFALLPVLPQFNTTPEMGIGGSASEVLIEFKKMCY